MSSNIVLIISNSNKQLKSKKDLGMYINKSLSYAHHINFICKLTTKKEFTILIGAQNKTLLFHIF